jgi:hypothetical protein
MAWAERYVRADADGTGNGTTDANSGTNGAWTLVQAIAGVAAGHRVNIKAGTYANTTNLRQFATAGTGIAPIWLRGFNTTIGDIDADNTLTKPQLTFTTGRLVVSGAEYIVSNLDVVVTGAVSNPAVSLSGTNIWADRLRVDNQHANALSSALSNTSGNLLVTRSYFKATATATAVVGTIGGMQIDSCYLRGGVSGFSATGTPGPQSVRNTVIDSPTTNGILAAGTATSGAARISGCTIYNTVNGINISGAPAGGTVENCILSTCTVGITNTTGANVNVHRLNNGFYACTTTESNFGDSPSVGALTESSDPFVAASTGNFALVDAAVSRGAGAPGGFENTTSVSYLDRGAVQVEAPTDAAVAAAVWAYANRTLTA